MTLTGRSDKIAETGSHLSSFNTSETVISSSKPQGQSLTAIRKAAVDTLQQSRQWSKYLRKQLGKKGFQRALFDFYGIDKRYF